jgi:hypothetical protein
MPFAVSAGSSNLIDDIRTDLRADKVQAAIRNRDTGCRILSLVYQDAEL